MSPPVRPAATSATETGSPAGALVDADVRDLYVRLLRGRPRTIVEIRALAPPGIDLAAALETLERDGLVIVGREGLEVQDPRAAVAARVQDALSRRRRAWERAAAAVAELALAADAWRAHVPDGVAVPGTVVVGDAVAWWHEALRLDDRAGLAVRSLAVARAWHGDGLLAERFRAGARLVVPTDELADVATRGLVAALGDAGVEVRALRRVPGWLAVGGAVALAARWDERDPSGVTRTADPSIVAALTWVFEDWWAGALPVEELDVFALLASGHDDLRIARILGLSTRAVQRRIAHAMEAAGARSRFELGVAYARTPAVIAGTVGN